MKTTIESINGKQYTVVWHDAVQSFNGTMTATHSGFVWHIGSKCVATLLPALPRYPKPEDARLLYRYMAEGIEPKGNVWIGGSIEHESYSVRGILNAVRIGQQTEITHALDSDGNRIEVAIEG